MTDLNRVRETLKFDRDKIVGLVAGMPEDRQAYYLERIDQALSDLTTHEKADAERLERIENLGTALLEVRTQLRDLLEAAKKVKQLIEQNTPDDVNPTDAWWGAWEILRQVIKNLEGEGT